MTTPSAPEPPDTPPPGSPTSPGPANPPDPAADRPVDQPLPASATPPPAKPRSSPPRGPQSLLAAVKLMYVGAGLQALSIAFTFAARAQLHDQISAQEPTFSPEEVDSALNLHLLSVAIIDVLAIAMWIWMAQTNRRGLEWARIVATVLAPLNIAFTVFSLSQAVGAMIVARLMVIALSGAILFLLYRPDSSRYYKAVANQARDWTPH